jgi:hypothetical protein
LFHIRGLILTLTPTSDCPDLTFWCILGFKVKDMKYALIGCEVLFREFCYAALKSNSAIDFALLPQGLHAAPGELRNRVQQEIERLESIESRQALPGKNAYELEDYDAILLGYGLCSNGVSGVKAGRIPLVVPRGHDCITLLLGSISAYDEYFGKFTGTYWYSSGWIERSLPPGPERSEALMKFYKEKYGDEKARALLEADATQYTSYKYAAYINWNFATAGRDREYTKKCAEFMGWEYFEVDGEPKLMVDFLGGNWDNEKFLIVPPGDSIAPSYDNCILKCVGTDMGPDSD